MPLDLFTALGTGIGGAVAGALAAWRASLQRRAPKSTNGWLESIAKDVSNLRVEQGARGERALVSIAAQTAKIVHLTETLDRLQPTIDRVTQVLIDRSR